MQPLLPFVEWPTKLYAPPVACEHVLQLYNIEPADDVSDTHITVVTK